MPALQQLLLGIYRLPAVNALMRTRLGARFYEVCYDLYKEKLEAAGTEALAAHIAPGTWAIDVGANVGFFTERFARWVSTGAGVIAIEPDTENLALLRRRIARLGLTNIVVHQAVAAERSGTLLLRRNPDQPTDHRIGDTGDPVTAVALDEVVEQAGSPTIGLIKIDTQGSEHRVLAGATRTLLRCRPNLFIEIDDGALRAGGASATQLIGDIQAQGYRFLKILPQGEEEPILGADLIASFAAGKQSYIDVLCVPAADRGPSAAGTTRSGE